MSNDEIMNRLADLIHTNIMRIKYNFHIKN